MRVCQAGPPPAAANPDGGASDQGAPGGLSHDHPQAAVAQRVDAFWRARHAAVEETVATLHGVHLRINPCDTDALCNLFLDLPVDWPLSPEDHGLSLGEVFRYEVSLFEQRVQEAHAAVPTLVDAWNTPLNLVKTLPLFMAVVCRFAE